MITDIVWGRKALGEKVGPFPSRQLLKAGFMGLRESGQRREKKSGSQILDIKLGRQLIGIFKEKIQRKLLLANV